MLLVITEEGYCERPGAWTRERQPPDFGIEFEEIAEEQIVDSGWWIPRPSTLPLLW